MAKMMTVITLGHGVYRVAQRAAGQILEYKVARSQCYRLLGLAARIQEDKNNQEEGFNRFQAMKFRPAILQKKMPDQ